MASSDVSTVSNHFPTVNEGFTNTTSSQTSAGATTIALTGTSGLTDTSVFVGIIEPGEVKEQTFTGTVDTGGSQITGVKWTRGTNADHAAGVTIVDYVTGTGQNMIRKGILVEHGQTGVHTNITGTTATLTGNITTSAGALRGDTVSEYTSAAGVTVDGLLIKDNYVVGSATSGVNNASLSTAAGALGAAWQTWAPTWTNLTAGNGTLDEAQYVQIGKTVFYTLKFTLGSSSSISGSVEFTLPVTQDTAAGDIIGVVKLNDTGTAGYSGYVDFVNTGKGRIQAHKSDATYLTLANLSSTVPFTWVATDVIHCSGTYEAA